MPFDAQRAQRDQQVSARLDAKLSEQAEVPAAGPSAAPAAPSTPTTAAPRRFQRDTGRGTAPPAEAPSASEPTSRFRRTSSGASPAPVPSSAPAPTASSASPARRPAPQAPARPQAQYEEGAQVPHAAPLQARGYGNRVRPARSTSVPGLTPRLELYIDDLGFQKGWSHEEILRRKNEAATRPDAAEREYRAQFDEIRRLRQETLQSLQQGLQTRPDQVLFVVQRGEQRRFSAMPKERAGSYALLHGSAFHSMPATATLFDAPEVVFARPAPPSPPSTEGAAPETVEATGDVPQEGRAPRSPRP